MNKYSKILIFLLIAGSLFISCDLDRFPENSIAAPESLRNIEDARNWDNGIFAFFRGRQYGIFTFAQDVQADQLNATIGWGNRNAMMHTWINLTPQDFTVRDVWFGYYRALVNVNHLINSYPELYGRLTSAADRALLNRFLGNAHLARAFYYNELALRWSPSFNPVTAATTLSIPLVTEFNVAERPARATLQEVYDLILSDIATARTLLAGVPGRPGYTRFSIDAVTALEARVRLYMQDWAGAFAAANSLITSGIYPLETTIAGLENLWIYDNSSEVIMQSHISAPLELPNALHPIAGTANIITNNTIYLTLSSATGFYSPDFLPSQWVVDMFDMNDIRRAVYFSNTGTIQLEGNQFTGIYRVTKFRGNPAIPNSRYGGGGTVQAASNAQAPKVFRIAEMYLIAAEAAFRMGNEAGALTALNTLRQARGLNAVNTLSAAVGSAPPQEIQDERFRELAFEGFRLFDLRRWGLGIERRYPQNTALLVSGDGLFNFTRPADNHMFVWPIPADDILTNPNLEQNRGW